MGTVPLFAAQTAWRPEDAGIAAELGLSPSGVGGMGVAWACILALPESRESATLGACFQGTKPALSMVRVGPQNRLEIQFQR